jgi:hypothetical protein
VLQVAQIHQRGCEVAQRSDQLRHEVGVMTREAIVATFENPFNFTFCVLFMRAVSQRKPEG